MAAKYPEHEKLSAIKDQSQICGNFLEWLRGKYTFAKAHSHNEDCASQVMRRGYDCGCFEGQLLPDNPSIERLLAEFFGIDQKRLEKEKQHMLDSIRKANSK